MNVYDPQTGTLSTGYTPSESMVPMLGPGGIDRQVPASQVRLFTESGYVLDTPEARREIELQHKYGEGLGNEIAAGGLGLARGLTFGLSDFALSRSGLVESQTLHELATRNPDATLAGEVGAFLVPAAGAAIGAMKTAGAVTRGVGIGARLAGSGITGLSKLSAGIGAAATEATGSALLGSAAQVAAESFAMNVAHNLSEAVLGDSQVTAEKLLAHSGQALFVGAGLGFGIPLASRAVVATASKAKEALSGLGDALKNRILPTMGDAAARGYSDAFGAISGKGKEGADEVFAMLEGSFTPAGLKKHQAIEAAVSPQQRDELYRAFYNQLDDAYRETEATVKRGFQHIRPREVEKLLADVERDPALEGLGELVRKIDDAATRMADDPLKYDQTYMRELRELATNLDKRTGAAKGGAKVGFDTAAEIWDTVNTTKQATLGDLASFGKRLKDIPRAEANSIREVRDVYKAFAEHLEDPKIYGDAATRQQAINSAFSSYRKLFDKGGEFRRQFMVNGSISADKVNSFLNRVGAGRDVEKMAALEDFISSSSALVEQVEKSALNVGVKDVDRAGFESIVGKLVATKAKAAEDLALASQIRAQDAFGLAFVNFQKGVQETLLRDGVFSATVRLAQKASSPFGVVSALSKAENFVLNTSGRISDSVGRFVSRAGGVTGKAATMARPYVESASLSILTKWLDGMSPDDKDHKSPRTRREAFKRASEKLTEMSADPATTAQKLTEGVQHLTPHAPATAQAIVETQLKAVQFLASKAPQNPGRGFALNPLVSNWQPSDGEIAKFERYAAAVADPLGALDDLQHGTVAPESVEVLQAVYPTLFEEVKQQLVERVGQIQKEIPYRDRLQLSLLFGLALDPSLEPSFVSAVQSSFTPAQEPRPAARPTSARSKTGALEETPAQRIARR